MKAGIFDVDGTLLDSMSVWEDIGERYLASQNITAEKNLRAALHTMSLEQGAAWMKEKYQLDKSISQIIEEVLKIVSDFYRFEAPLKPGVKKTLEWFKERNIQKQHLRETGFWIILSRFTPVQKQVQEKMNH